MRIYTKDQEEARAMDRALSPPQDGRKSGKVRLGLLPWESVVAAARHMTACCAPGNTLGYVADDWRTQTTSKDLVDAALRHLVQHSMGETWDRHPPRQTNERHLVCALVDLLMAVSLEINNGAGCGRADRVPTLFSPVSPIGTTSEDK